MRITAIKQQVKNPSRASIFIDGKYGFSFSLDELVSYKLKLNQELSPAEVKKFKKISSDGKLRARALEWLINRPHSEREFRTYLFRKKTDEKLVDELVKDFTGKGYLDDYKFGQWLVELLVRRGKSDRAIRAELYKKGVNRETTDRLFKDSSTGKDEAARLAGVIDKKRRLSRYKNDPQKLMKYLVSQGFGWQLVKDALGGEQLNEN